MRNESEDQLTITEDVGMFEDLLKVLDEEGRKTRDVESEYDHYINTAAAALRYAKEELTKACHTSIFHEPKMAESGIACRVCENSVQSREQARCEPCPGKLDFSPGDVIRYKNGGCFGYIKGANAAGTPREELADPYYSTVDGGYLKVSDQGNFEAVGRFRPGQRALERVPENAHGELVVGPKGEIVLWSKIDYNGLFWAWNTMGNTTNVPAQQSERTGIHGSFLDFCKVDNGNE
jgi:hypothetical protein